MIKLDKISHHRVNLLKYYCFQVFLKMAPLILFKLDIGTKSQLSFNHYPERNSLNEASQ